MAQNYAASHLNKIDERFYTESVIKEVINNGMRLDFNGKNSVTIYNVDVVEEVDYVRSGTKRFGALVEVGTGTQTFTLSQDKAFTATIDRGNLNDSMMVQEANKWVKRQVREKSIPNTDKYVLATAAAYAVSASQTTGSVSLTASNAYQNFIVGTTYMVDAEVGRENLVCFITATTHGLLKRDPEFVRDCDKTYADLKSGVIGRVDGVMLKEVPSSYLPAGVHYLFMRKDVLIVPMKFNSVRVLTDVQGIDGAVPEGRRYYDCFIPTNRGKAIYSVTT